jgi:thiol-disulfide isomerase/thioredoxin
MLRIALLSSFGVALMIALGDAFSSPCAFFSLHRSARLERNSYYARNPIIVMAVSDVSNEESFDTIIKDAKGSLVVIDYSTTWCGPCKVIAPKFDELSDKYPQAKFLKVRNSNPLDQKDPTAVSVRFIFGRQDIRCAYVSFSFPKLEHHINDPPSTPNR